MGRKRGTQYRSGGYYIQDDRTGFTVRAEEAKMQWNYVYTDKKYWEPRQPQDLVKGIPDDQNVAIPRPLGPGDFDGPIYTATTANVAIGDTFIPLQYIAGFNAGDAIGVMMDYDNGTWFNATVQSVESGGINIYTALPYPASSGNLVVDYLIPGAVPEAATERITEDDEIRITEDGDIRILE